MYPHQHFIAALAVGTISLLFNQKAPLLAIEVFGNNITVFCLCLVSGVLIDIDHLVDFQLNRRYLHESPRIPSAIGRITPRVLFEKGRMYVPFHGMENMPILAVLCIIFPFLIFPTISYIVHITLDVYGNNVSRRAYFYTIRLRKIMSVALGG